MIIAQANQHTFFKSPLRIQLLIFFALTLSFDSVVFLLSTN